MDNSNISGSRYLDGEFKEGDICMNGKYKIFRIPLRYNLHSVEFQFKNKNLIMVIADHGSIDKIVIGDEMCIFIRDKEQKNVSGYVKIWNSQLPAVLTKIKVVFLEREKPKPYTETKPDRFERVQDKY